MKVYLVVWTSDAVQYPQYSVEKVFAYKKDAESYIEKAKKDMYPHGKNFRGIHGEPWIEEFEVE